jgi:DNA-binding CsgD family transcriptional regulator
MDETNGGREVRLAAGLAAVFLSILVLAAADLLGDARASTGLRHMALEAAVATAGLLGFVGMAHRYMRLSQASRRLTEQTRGLEADLSLSRAEAARWRNEARDLIAGLGAAIDQQLDRWGLSPAEKDVAILLLKGLSHKDIGEVRGVAEATVRQQARAMYRKAGLAGRADLAAFFLEDLLSPRPERAADAREP